jgi:hypothetical protein
MVAASYVPQRGARKRVESDLQKLTHNMFATCAVVGVQYRAGRHYKDIISEEDSLNASRVGHNPHLTHDTKTDSFLSIGGSATCFIL